MVKVVGGLSTQLFFKVMPVFFFFFKQNLKLNPMKTPPLSASCLPLIVATLTLRELFLTEADVTEDKLGLGVYV